MSSQANITKTFFEPRVTHGRFAMTVSINFPPRNQQGTILTGKIRRSVKFGAFWCVLLAKIEVYPKRWRTKLFIKQLRQKKIPKDNFT